MIFMFSFHFLDLHNEFGVAHIFCVDNNLAVPVATEAFVKRHTLVGAGGDGTLQVQAEEPVNVGAGRPFGHLPGG